MANEFEYYRIQRDNDNSIPILSQDSGCPDYLYMDDPIENPELMLFRFGKPIPRKPKMADYHSTPSSVISKKIFDILAPMKIEGIQLLPARIKGKDEDIFTDYWAIHVYSTIECIDRRLSDCVIDDISIGYVKKLVLEKQKLAELPLEKRLVFRLQEDFAYQLYHASIKEKIMSVNPIGIKFTNIEDWNEGSFFSN